ncbi:C40 family peptidase [Rhodococcus erythropolis]|uniref:C40 family peptidase n=1 Tax=Rhodococcus erythropolis TaxID=1833 RepID=UPI001C9B8044|nr:C40 family peptidase [Rhodococcus erythropolis]
MSTGDEVSSILNQLRGLLGEGTPVTAPLPSQVPDQIQQRLNALPGGLGAFIDKLIDDRKSQAEISAELAKIDPSLVPVVDESADNVTGARDQLDGIHGTYDDRRGQLAPVEGTPMGQLGVLQAKADAVGNGANTVREQIPPADLRRVMVDRLAQRYYEQAKAAMQGAGGGMPGGGQSGGGGGGMPGGGQSGGGGGGSPLSALTSPAASLASAFKPASSTHEGSDDEQREAAGLPSGRGGSEAGRKIAEKALTAKGLPYVWGGGNASGPTGGGFDCSGLVQWSYAQAAGAEMPRTTYDQINLGTRISPVDAQPGDLVFSRFSNRGPEHVQIALGGGQVVHAPQSGDVVRIAAMPRDVVVKRIL